MNAHIADTIRVVFFDHDDTLVGTIGTKWAHHKHVAKTYYGKELGDDEIRKHWGKPLRELTCLLYGTDNVNEAMAYNTATHKDFEKNLFEATIPTLRRLHSLGLTIGVITATSRYSFDHDLDHHGIPREILAYTQSADDTDFHKPDPRVFDPALAWLAERGLKPAEVLYVGDGLHDMKAAVGAGFNFLGVQTGLVTGDEFTAAEARSITSIAELAD